MSFPSKPMIRVVVCFLLLSPILASAADKRPNIILIMADDLGVECLGSYGGLSYKTPHLDKIASEGLRFTHAYSQPLCTNTRIQIMTGKYNNRNWKFFGILDPKEKTFGHDMQQAGYDTCIVGKWQLHSYDPPEYPGAQKRRGTGMKIENAGFDHHLTWHIGHTEDKGSRYADPRLARNGDIIDFEGKYGPDIFVNEIETYLDTKKSTEKPFFLYYSMALPHWPMVPTPKSPDWKDPGLRHSEDTKHFKDMVEYMDQSIGKIVQKVDDLKLAEETLIIFYSDNGTHLKITSQTKDGPVKGGKGMTTNAGTHVPMIVRWTGEIQPGVNNDLIDSTDFRPTLVEAANSQLRQEESIDGISFLPILKGQERPKPRRIIFSHYDPRPGWDKDQFTKIRFARTKRYKLYGDGSMFDIRKDELEERSLSTVNDSERMTADRKRLKRVLEKMPNLDPAPRD